MSFDRRDVRTAMDVYTKDNEYLGTVLRVEAGPPSEVQAPQGARTPNSHLEGSAVSGELLGPVPTQALGNRGPLRQTPRAAYASAADAAPLGRGTLTVGRWFGLVGRRRLPLDAVQTVSLERVVLRLTGAEIKAGRTASKEDQ